MFTSINTLFPNHSLEGESCAICTDDFVAGDLVLAHDNSNIPHAFHELCIQEWLAIGAKCPTCNYQITHVNGTALMPHVQDVPDDDDAPREEAVISLEEHLMLRDRAEAVFAASTAGDLEQLRPLLGGVSLDVRGDALVRATVTGRLETVNAILESGAGETGRQTALLVASERGYSAIVNAILANGNISAEIRGLATKEAAHVANLEIVNALLANGEISEMWREAAVTNAIYKRNTEIVNALLAHGNITRDGRGNALRCAILEGNNPEIISALLASGPISEMHYLSATSAVGRVPKNQQEATIQLLNTAQVEETWD